jgi:hypothetical protein
VADPLGLTACGGPPLAIAVILRTLVTIPMRRRETGYGIHFLFHI